MRFSRSVSWKRRLAMIALATGLIVVIMRTVQAGSLSPPASPASTMYTLVDIFDPLTSTLFDASAMASSSTGNALQIGKCIIYQMHGGDC